MPPAAAPAPVRPAAVILPVAWLGFLCGSMGVALADLLPWRLTFVRADNLLVCFTAAQLFFALFLWPLFIPAVAAKGEARPLLAQLGGFVLLGLPLALVCASVSDAGTAGLLRSQSLVAAVAALVAAIHAPGLRRGWRVGPWYVLGAFAVSGGLPFLAFLQSDFRPPAAGGLSWVAALSPFWGASRVDGAGSLVQAAAWAALAGAILAADRAFRKEAAP